MSQFVGNIQGNSDTLHKKSPGYPSICILMVSCEMFTNPNVTTAYVAKLSLEIITSHNNMFKIMIFVISRT